MGGRSVRSLFWPSRARSSLFCRRSRTSARLRALISTDTTSSDGSSDRCSSASFLAFSVHPQPHHRRLVSKRQSQSWEKRAGLLTEVSNVHPQGPDLLAQLFVLLLNGLHGVLVHLRGRHDAGQE